MTNKKRKRNEAAAKSKGNSKKYKRHITPPTPVLDVSRDDATLTDFQWLTRFQTNATVSSSTAAVCKSMVGYDLGQHIATIIEQPQWTKITGCVAWLSDPKLLKTLHKRNIPCQFVVQKERFLKSLKTLRARYDKLEWNKDMAESCTSILAPKPGHMLPESFTTTSDKLAAVRCAGNIPVWRLGQANLMHHKFAVFHDAEGPVAVITGSFNWSANAALSRENVMYIEDRALAMHYALEHLYVLAHSEPLDWKSKRSKSSYAILS